MARPNIYDPQIMLALTDVGTNGLTVAQLEAAIPNAKRKSVQAAVERLFDNRLVVRAYEWIFAEGTQRPLYRTYRYYALNVAEQLNVPHLQQKQKPLFSREPVPPPAPAGPVQGWRWGW
jgi:hypothetical protein